MSEPVAQAYLNALALCETESVATFGFTIRSVYFRHAIDGSRNCEARPLTLARRTSPAAWSALHDADAAAGPDAMPLTGLIEQFGADRHRAQTESLWARTALSKAASPAAVAFEAARSAPMARGFGLPTIMRCVPAPSNQGTQQRRVGRSSASGILPIWTNRRSPSGVLSPLQCRRELISIPPGQGLCQASAQSFGERQQQGPEAIGVTP